jgi:predicted lipoprotein
MTRSAQRVWLARGGVVMAVAILLWLMPLFHVVPIDSARQRADAGLFDAGAYVESFWTERLLLAASQAVDALDLVTELNRDPQAATKKHGRRLGLSSATCYFVSGAGHIQSVAPFEITISLGEDPAGHRVVIETGPVFGNVVRDGSGLLEVNDFPNSRDFNAISAELNRRVEERVLPILASSAAIGAKVRFVGCAEVPHEHRDTRAEAGSNREPRALRVVPILIEFP